MLQLPGRGEPVVEKATSRSAGASAQAQPLWLAHRRGDRPQEHRNTEGKEMNVCAQYELVSVVDDVILIRDLDGPVSVTNDAEAVVDAIIRLGSAPRPDGRPWRIHYIDTMGNKDELLHTNGEWTGFKVVQKEGRNY
jgi:hypothetical protein